MFITNCATLTTYVCADPRTCRGFSRGCCHVLLSNGESCEILLRIFNSDDRDKAGNKNLGAGRLCVVLCFELMKR